MKALDILHAQCGAVASRVDGSLTLKFITPEMLPSQAGYCIGLHGKNVRLTIIPEDDAPEEVVTVDTPREQKSASTRQRAVLFLWWKQQGQQGTFDGFYAMQMEKIIDHLKTKLDQ